MSFHPEHDWIKRWATYTPNRMVLRDYASGAEWTYVQFNARAERLAHCLTHDLKLKKGERVAILAQNRCETILLFAACVKTGLILVPLNFRYTARELDVMVADADPAALIHDVEYANRVSDLTTHKNLRVVSDYSPLERFLIDEPSAHESAQITYAINETDPVLILYTAGSTGRPKGVVITHKMLFWNAINTALRLDITNEDHTQSYAPFCHTGGWNVLLTPFLHHGASHTLLNKFDPSLVLRLMEEERTTLFFGVPTMLQMMAETPEFESADLSSVRYAVVGGAPMPEPLINRWHDKGVFIRQGYGLTEVGPNCFSLHQDDAIRKRGSIGFPNFYIDAKIAGPDGSDPGPNQPGDLLLRSPVVTPGYWRNPEATAESLRDDWFNTGDIVQRDEEGFYYVVDRKKNMIISGGSNVYPAEIERFLYTHPAIREVAVIGIPDEKWGEVGKAYVSLNPETSLNTEQLIQYCEGQLAGYKTPKHVVILADLPKNDAGKINRLALESLHENGD
jgi:fatty-acyl-CoA synthase